VCVCMCVCVCVCVRRRRSSALGTFDCLKQRYGVRRQLNLPTIDRSIDRESWILKTSSLTPATDKAQAGTQARKETRSRQGAKSKQAPASAITMYYQEARRAHAEVEKKSKAHREALKRKRERQRKAASRDPHRQLMVEGRACKLLRGEAWVLIGVVREGEGEWLGGGWGQGGSPACLPACLSACLGPSSFD
jgi:hypothetical protein